IDQFGAPACAPDPRADAARQLMLSRILTTSAHTIGELLVKMPGALQRVVQALEDRSQVSRIFRQLDVDGDGSLTFGEIFTFHGDSTGALDKLLPNIEKELQLGLAGEDVETLPGVTLADLLGGSRKRELANLHARFADGIFMLQERSRTEPSAVQIG